MRSSTQQWYLQNENKIDTNVSTFVYHAQAQRRSVDIIVLETAPFTPLYTHKRMHTIKISKNNLTTVACSQNKRNVCHNLAFHSEEMYIV
jgi:hypothetical protein